MYDNYFISFYSLLKILKCSGNDDVATIKAEDNNLDQVQFIFESPSKLT